MKLSAVSADSCSMAFSEGGMHSGVPGLESGGSREGFQGRVGRGGWREIGWDGMGCTAPPIHIDTAGAIRKLNAVCGSE